MENHLHLFFITVKKSILLHSFTDFQTSEGVLRGH